jgi:hypothetical protein
MHIVVGPYLDRQECDARRAEIIQKELVAKCLGEQWVKKIQLAPEDLLPLVMEKYEEPIYSRTVGPMVNLHLLVRFDHKIQKQILDAQRQWIVQTRLRQAGVGLGGAWLALGIIWGYLRLDQTSGGRYRGRLRLATGLILAAAATAVWMVV